MFLPPIWPVEPARARAPASLWDKCIVALPMWQTLPRNVVEGAFTTTVGTPALVPTPRGYGLNFSGTDQSLTFPAVFTSNRITISFMFRRMAQPTSTQVLFELSPNYNNTERAFSIFLFPDDLARLNIHDSGANYHQRDYVLPPIGQMVFCTATFEHGQNGGKGNVRLWMNGVDQVGTLLLDSTFVRNGTFLAQTVYIAARNGIELETQTQMSSVLVHDRLLSDTEIKLLHADPFQMFAPDAEAFASTMGEAGGAGGGGDVVPGGAIKSAVKVTGGALGQSHKIAGGTIQSAPLVSGGGIAQSHKISGGAVQSGVMAGGGSLKQTHRIAGAVIQSTAKVSGGALGQSHKIAGGTIQSQTRVSGGAMAVPGVDAVAGGAIRSLTRVSGGGIGQTHKIAGGEIRASVTVSGGVLRQTHLVAGGAISVAVVFRTVPNAGPTIEITVPGVWRAPVVAGKWRSA